MSVRDLLKVAWRSFRHRPRPDGADQLEGLEAKVKALFCDFADRAHLHETGERNVLGQTEPSPDAVVYVRALDLLLEQARQEGRDAAVEALRERIGWECVCRCREHHQIGCPRCTATDNCAIHAEPDPSWLNPDVLEDAPRLAARLNDAVAELAATVDPGGAGDWPSTWPWNETPAVIRAAWIEAVRREVCARYVEDRRRIRLETE